MNRILWHIMMMTAMVLSLSSCDNANDEITHRVLVMHSWANRGEEGEHFRTMMEKEFAENNCKVKIKHIYTNVLHYMPEDFATKKWPEIKKEITDWNPEVILINDDVLFDFISNQHVADSIFVNTPSVFAGVTTLTMDSIRRFPDMTGFEDRIKVTRNLDLFAHITGECEIGIELDQMTIDNKIRQQIQSILANNPKFIDNSDYHIREFTSESLRKEYPGCFVVTFFSMANPQANATETDSIDHGKVVMRSAMLKAPNRWMLQVKYDVYSNALIDNSKRPQFTCIREQFNDPDRVRFLGGFFVSTDTQIKDQVTYAVKILNGTRPKDLPIMLHESEYYMDYRAMQMLGLDYKDYKGQFQIVNLPDDLAHPARVFMKMGLIGLCIVAVIAIIMFIVYHWKNNGKISKLLEDLSYEELAHDLIFRSNHDTVWTYEDGYFEIDEKFALNYNVKSYILSESDAREMVHPDSMAAFESILDFRCQHGHKSVRLLMGPPTEPRKWIWTEILYTATEETTESGKISGILLDIDDKKKEEDAQIKAQQEASEIAVKEHFLASISHDLRTPLNAITGFSTLLIDDETEVAAEDRKVFVSLIHQNTDMVLEMIDGVLKVAQTEDINVKCKNISVGELVKECFITNNVIAPSHLKMIFKPTEKECFVNADDTCTKQVINNFLGNAFKFTPSGSITLGWNLTSDGKEVEVYVADTGIGITERNQRHIFDRYYKAQENDKGTGLGLNISKTIIEKQGGTIGVTSQLGKGSKFWFRLKRVFPCLIAMIMSMAAMTSCQTEKKGQINANVIVVHGYDKDFVNYDEMNRAVKQAFEKENVNADIRNLYLGLSYSLNSGKQRFVDLLDSLKKENWKPDLIICEGDRPQRDISHYYKDLEEIHDVPIVFGGLHHPIWDFIKSSNNIVGIWDPIDYRENINLAVEFSGSNVVQIELDYFEQDSTIRYELRQSINRPPYIDNTDWHLSLDELDNPKYNDNIIVCAISTESPENNALLPLSPAEAEHKLWQIYTNAWKYGAMTVKSDIYSSSIIDRTERPQVSAVKAGFNEGGKFIAGYFANYETVANDIVHIGVMKMMGSSEVEMATTKHAKEHYMNYDVMRNMGLRYNEYSNRFVIYGAPFRFKHPRLYMAIWAGCILLALAVMVIIVASLRARKANAEKKILSKIVRKNELRKLALQGADSQPLHNESEVRTILSCIHKSKSDILPLISEALSKAGRHDFDIYADINHSGNYRWWQIRILVFYKQGFKNDDSKKYVKGLLINIDETKNYEAKLQAAKDLAEETRKKEDFFKMISHEIRTPLNCVVGFSDIIASSNESNPISPEELEYFRSSIIENNKKLIYMIEEVLMFSRIESGSLKYEHNDINVRQMLESIGEEWSEKMPDGLTLSVTNYPKDVYVNGDISRLRFAIGILLDNSVKFTDKGHIFIGVNYHYSTEEVQISVEDSGCGIPENQQSAVFELFWKADSFVPGIGLGLNLAKRLAEGMDGRITFESKVNQGSIFSIFLKAKN